ncbi:MAG TPA: GNAT family N-acetyltransferase [Flavobacterium alvei]|nr:GNAT family N-acetyltransferase [Flavobacterium alvei]
MITFKRTNSDDPNFQELVKLLDLELQERDGEEHLFYATLNKTNTLNYVVVAYDQNEVVGCGALRNYSNDTMEVKRMFVPLHQRGQGIASTILAALETWCRELGIKKCILETGKNQPEAIALYKKNRYNIIPNFGKYEGVENSVCFEKEL